MAIVNHESRGVRSKCILQVSCYEEITIGGHQSNEYKDDRPEGLYKKELKILLIKE
jgi:hypothetical protein